MKQYSSLSIRASVIFIICAVAFCAGAQVGALKEAPPPDPNVVNGTADTKFSNEWWKVYYKDFKQALGEENSDQIVSIAREVADGWRYNVPATYEILVKAVDFLQLKQLERPDDLIELMTARAEAAQYMRSGNDFTRDYLAAEVLCVPYQRAMVYKSTGQYLLALQELEQFYKDGQAERARLRNSPYPLAGNCPLEEKEVLADLLQTHLVLALAEDSPQSVAHHHFQSAYNYIEVLLEHVGPGDFFWWGDEKLSAHFVGKPVWSVASLSLYLARQLQMPPSEYMELAGDTVDQLTGPEPFTLDDSIEGLKYLESGGADEAQLWDFLQMCQTYFAGWPAGEDGFEYQSCALQRLQFAISRRNIPNAEAVIAELSGVSFADPNLLERFNHLQLNFQYMLQPPPVELPMGDVLDGMVTAMRADAESSMPSVDQPLTTTEKAVSFARHHPVTLLLLGITLACFVALIAMRVRSVIFRKGQSCDCILFGSPWPWVRGFNNGRRNSCNCGAPSLKQRPYESTHTLSFSFWLGELDCMG